jgi:hypothetical protein
MDFIVGLPTTEKGFYSIWVIADRLAKSAHFIPIKSNYHPHNYADIYFQQVVRLHGVPKSIVFDRRSQFIARFWERLHHNLGTKLIRSSAYHPQTSGQTEHVNQILEDMLRASLISCKGSWEKWFLLAEFSYNNSYQESIKMAPFEALYGRKCRTPLNWVEPRERRFYGIDFVKEVEEQVCAVQKNMAAAQARQKSYADKGRKPIEFGVGDHVYLRYHLCGA